MMADYSDVIEQAGRQFNVDPKLLALVMGQESGGNPAAVSSKGAAGPMQVMPGTAKDMGVTNPADPVQNIMAGAKYLSQQLGKYGDVPTALAAYNAGPGAVDKHGGIPPFPETQGYVKSIMTAYQGGGAQAPAAAPAPQAMPGLPPVAGSLTPARPAQGDTQAAQMPGLPPTAAPAPQAAAADPFAALVARAGGIPAQGKQAAPAQPSADPFSQLVAQANAATQAPTSPSTLDQLKSMTLSDPRVSAAELGASLATGALGSLAGGATRLGASVFGENFNDAKAAGDKVQNFLTYKPQTEGGKAATAVVGGIASDAKNALMSSPVGSALHSVGNAYDNTFVKGATNPLMATVNDMIPAAAANVAGGKLGGAALDLAKAAPAAVESAAGKVAALVGKGNAETVPTPTSAPASTLPGVGAASANLNPYPALTGEVAARGGSSSFPQVKLSQISSDVPLAEQQTRAKIANEILGDDHGQVREGVITGNEDTLRNEHTQASSAENTPAQLMLRAQIAKEQQALTDYAQARVEATGANPNLTNNYQRGQVINDAFHGEGGLSDYFSQAKQQIYDQAKAESGDNPIQTQHVDTLLADPQFLAEAERNGHTGVVSGAQKLIDLARTTGFKDPITGEVHAPGSVAAWDAVRKSNNAGWSPDNARTIGAINQAIDQDVAAAAGSDAYKMGDAVHKAEKTIMDTPAIRDMFGGADANGIKDGAAMEKLPTLMNNMSIDKWTHIHNTLDDLSRGIVRGAPEGMPAVPQETRDLAAAAKAEMHGALAREVYEKGAGNTGVWNQNEANKTLNSVVGQKILNTFDPDEIQRFHTLNLGGQIMPGKHSYEGGGQQTLRLSRPGLIEKHAGKAGAVAGGIVGTAINPWLGGPGTQSGAVLGGKLAGRSASKRLQGESNKLLDAMRSNSKLGHGNRLSN